MLPPALYRELVGQGFKLAHPAMLWLAEHERAAELDLWAELVAPLEQL
jgi:hypothetical protein